VSFDLARNGWSIVFDCEPDSNFHTPPSDFSTNDTPVLTTENPALKQKTAVRAYRCNATCHGGVDAARAQPSQSPLP
jgi:hypothetical protein